MNINMNKNPVINVFLGMLIITLGYRGLDTYPALESLLMVFGAVLVLGFTIWYNWKILD